jgi:FtsP/CotA-like multicopper oxidase with cupredoxin domain
MPAVLVLLFADCQLRLLMVTRRQMLKLFGMAAGSALLPASGQQPALADYTIRIAPIRLEIAPGRTVKTTAFNGRVPGELIRLQEGKTAAIDVINDTDVPDIVHWHGLQIPASEDGASEEGSPVSAPHGGRQRYVFTAKPAGFRWYHSHIYAGHNLNRSMYSGEFGFLMIDAAQNPGRYDQESFLALHDWNGYISGASDGYQEVAYNHATINDKMLGSGEPIRVRQQERVLFHILNASATLMHTVSLPGHKFLVVALDGNPVSSPRLVDTLRLGPAERVDAIVVMDHPGVWVLGEMDDAIRKAGMGIVIEYEGRSGEPQWAAPANVDFHYELFGGAQQESSPEDGNEVSIPLVFQPKFKGYGDFDHWTINGNSWPQTSPIQLHEGSRYRLVLDNQSDDIHPVHLHRHTFEVKQINGTPTEGIWKDVLLLPTRAKTEVVFTANNPGKTLFHCHQQDHMDSGFMMLFDYTTTK